MKRMKRAGVFAVVVAAAALGLAAPASAATSTAKSLTAEPALRRYAR